MRVLGGTAREGGGGGSASRTAGEEKEVEGVETEDARDGRLDRRFQMPQQGKVDAPKPSMRLDLAGATPTPQPLVLILAQQLLDDALAQGRRRLMVGEVHFVAQDVGEGGMAVGSFEGGRAVEHFVDEDAEGPPVARKREWSRVT